MFDITVPKESARTTPWYSKQHGGATVDCLGSTVTLNNPVSVFTIILLGQCHIPF
jgi:hypothetical protein